MKTFINLMAVAAFSIMLSACVGDSTTNKTATTPNSTPTSTDIARKLNMSSAIYQAFRNYSGLPSGTLTLTTDSVGTEVSGKYSVIDYKSIPEGKLVSAGTVSGSTSKLLLVNTYPGCKENMSIYPSSVTNDSTQVIIYGQDCSGKSIVAIENIKKVSGSLVVANTSIAKQPHIVDMTISASSADNVTFLGTLTLNNSPLKLSGKATVVGYNSDSRSNAVPFEADVRFNVTNFSGHLFSPVDVLTFPDDSTYIHLKEKTGIDRFIVNITDTYPLTQSILLGELDTPSTTIYNFTPPLAPL